jgi:uncharacterized repeat protein (TIGR02543 family)
MATTRAVGLDLGNYFRIASVTAYTNTGGVTYRGWATNYAGGVSAYAEPAAPVVLGNQRVAGKDGSNARPDPSTANPEVVSAGIGVGKVGTFVGWVLGQDIGGNKIWFVQQKNDVHGNIVFYYNWSGGFADKGTHDLKNRNVSFVAFDADGGTPVPAQQSVFMGDTASAPEIPVKDGYVFGGWAQGDGKLWDFGTSVQIPLSLTAVWTPIPSTGGASIEEIAKLVNPRFDAIDKALAELKAQPSTVYNFSGTATPKP